MTEVVRQLDGFGWFLVDVGWKSTTSLLLVGTIDRVFLRHRPIAADAVWFATFLVLLVLPLCCYFLPRVTIPILIPVSATSALPVEASTYPLAINDNSDRTSDPLPHSRDREPLASMSANDRPHEPFVAERLEADPVAPPLVDKFINVVPIISLIYGLGVLAMVIRLTKGVLSVARLKRDALAVSSASWMAVFHEHKRRLGIRRAVWLCHSPAVSVPMTVGWMRPMVILPSSSLRESDRRTIEVVVLHELTHIARGDYFALLVNRIVECIYWSNPLTWLASRRLGRIREAMCDGYCVSTLDDREGYVSVLFAFARKLTLDRHAALGLAMARSSRLETRVADIALTNRHSASIAARLGTILVALVVTGSLGAVAVGQSPLGDEVTIGDIVEGLRKREQSIETLIVHYDGQSTINIVAPGGEPPARGLIEDDAVSLKHRSSVSWEIGRDGRGRMETTGVRISIRSDGTNITRRETSIWTANGKNGWLVKTVGTESGAVISHRRNAMGPLMSHGGTPFDFATHHTGKTISEFVSLKGATVVGRAEWEQRAVVIVETAPVAVRDDYLYRQRFWIDPGRNYSVVRGQIFVQRGEGTPWALSWQSDKSNSEEVLPGIWLPKTIDQWGYQVEPTGQGHLVSREHMDVSKWSANAALDPARFEVEPSSLEQIGSPIRGEDPKEQPAFVDQADALAPLEEAADAARIMVVRTVDGEGKPVANTKLRVNMLSGVPGVVQEYVTDANGQAMVDVPAPSGLFRMWTHQDGYVSLFAQWWPEHQPDGHLIPDEFTLSLPAGTKIGGIVKNEDGDPIEGVMVEAVLVNQIDEMSRRPVASYWLTETTSPCVTDAEGRWSLDCIPAGDDIHVRVKLTHLDYISDTEWGGLQTEQSITMTALRDGSATIVMRRGVAPRDL